jgi:hypothetical protein
MLYEGVRVNEFLSSQGGGCREKKVLRKAGKDYVLISVLSAGVSH